MFKVGLTGGIASGKTTISRIFESLDIKVIDTDLISHDLMQPGQSAYQKTLDRFGHQILLADTTLNRSLLREIVFNDSAQKTWLEQMLHPLIRQQACLLMDKVNKQDYLILVVPLLFETDFDELVDHVIAIDCSRETQLVRLTKRDGINHSLAERMLSAQMDNQHRLNKADSIIENSENFDLTGQIHALHQHLSELGKNFVSRN